MEGITTSGGKDVNVHVADTRALEDESELSQFNLAVLSEVSQYPDREIRIRG